MAIDLDAVKLALAANALVMHEYDANLAEELIAEIERLRAELTATLVACERCGRGVRARYRVLGLCTECAEARMVELLGIVNDLQYQRDHWHREADKWHAEAERLHLEGDELQAQVFGALQRIYGCGD